VRKGEEMKEPLAGNRSVKALSAMLRSFVREGRFERVDGLKGINSLKEFEEWLFDSLRDARSNPKAFIPSEDQLEEVLSLARERLEELKTAIGIYALSFPERREEG
jgi:hypothetical protein